MADVPRVLLDQVDQDAPQAGGLTAGGGEPGQPVQAAECHSQSGSASQSTAFHEGPGSRPSSHGR